MSEKWQYGREWNAYSRGDAKRGAAKRMEEDELIAQDLAKEEGGEDGKEDKLYRGRVVDKKSEIK